MHGNVSPSTVIVARVPQRQAAGEGGRLQLRQRCSAWQQARGGEHRVREPATPERAGRWTSGAMSSALEPCSTISSPGRPPSDGDHLARAVPRVARPILAKALAVSPAARFQTMSQLREALEQLASAMMMPPEATAYWTVLARAAVVGVGLGGSCWWWFRSGAASKAAGATRFRCPRPSSARRRRRLRGRPLRPSRRPAGRRRLPAKRPSAPREASLPAATGRGLTSTLRMFGAMWTKPAGHLSRSRNHSRHRRRLQQARRPERRQERAPPRRSRERHRRDPGPSWRRTRDCGKASVTSPGSGMAEDVVEASPGLLIVQLARDGLRGAQRVLQSPTSLPRLQRRDPRAGHRRPRIAPKGVILGWFTRYGLRSAGRALRPLTGCPLRSILAASLHERVLPPREVCLRRDAPMTAFAATVAALVALTSPSTPADPPRFADAHLADRRQAPLCGAGRPGGPAAHPAARLQRLVVLLQPGASRPGPAPSGVRPGSQGARRLRPAGRIHHARHGGGRRGVHGRQGDPACRWSLGHSMGSSWPSRWRSERRSGSPDSC